MTRLALLASILTSLLMISVCSSYTHSVIWATKSDDPLRHYVFLLSTPLGVIGGAIQIAHLMQEKFVDLGAIWNGIIGLVFYSVPSVLWGIAGRRTARRTGTLRSSVMAGCWSAIVTMSILVLFGFVVEFYLATPRPEHVITWREFKRSGCADIHAFTIANTVDAAQSHLIIGPIIGRHRWGLAGVNQVQHAGAYTRLHGAQQLQ
jgi:hypothetical protein